MNNTLITPVAPLAGSTLNRRSLLAGLSGAALWAFNPRSSAAILSPPSPAAPASQILLPFTDLTLALIQETRPSPPRAARTLALVHVAMAEAALGSNPTTIDVNSALTGAATTVLGQLFPQAARRIAEMEQKALRSNGRLGSLPSQPRQAGLAVGRRIGQAVLEWAQDDGSDTVWDGERPVAADNWQPTPPEFREDPVEPLAGSWRTWVLSGGDALRPPPPPDGRSPVWEAELLAVREAVQRRTPEQETAARFWAGGPGTSTPAGIWIEIARELIVRDHLDALAAAQVLALTSVAMADGFICCWDAKYAFWTARPITADPTLDVLIPTPPFPSYTSGHATISAAAATVLGHLFPMDAPELLRQAAEARNSRLWAGIHFPLDNEMGALGGGVIGRLVIARAAETGVAWDRIRAAGTLDHVLSSK